MEFSFNNIHFALGYHISLSFLSLFPLINGLRLYTTDDIPMYPETQTSSVDVIEKSNNTKSNSNSNPSSRIGSNHPGWTHWAFCFHRQTGLQVFDIIDLDAFRIENHLTFENKPKNPHGFLQFPSCLVGVYDFYKLNLLPCLFELVDRKVNAVFEDFGSRGCEIGVDKGKYLLFEGLD